MGDDDEPSISSSALPWFWVTEALAGFREISISTLQDLVDAAPVGPDDFGENTRELVAMRCLEELSAISARGVDRDASSALDSKVRFDFSRSCEDVLQEILDEIPSSNLNMAGAELLKWDIYPFVMHKRAGTIKCYLKQLKESILEGTQPLTDYLKERSRLFRRTIGYTVDVNNSNCDDHSAKDDGNCTYAENMGAKESSVSLTLEDGNKSSKEHLPGNNILPSKRNRVDSSDEHIMRCLHEKQVCTNECDDFLRNTKRIKCYTSTNFDSKKEMPVSEIGKEVSEKSTEFFFRISEKGGHHTEKNNRETLSDESLEDSHNRYTASNLCQSSSHNEVFHDESNTPFNASVMPQHTFGGENSQQQQFELIPTNAVLPDEIPHKISGSKLWSKHENLQLNDSNGSQQTDASDKAQDDTGNGCVVEMSGDKIVYEGEKIMCVRKKHEELGMECNEGSQLQVCETTTVPLVVPESFLVMTTNTYPQHRSGVEPCQNTSMDETNYTTIHVEPIPTNDDNANKIQHMINESQPKQREPNVASLNASQKPVASDKTVVDGSHNEKIDLAAKKHDRNDQDLSVMTESTKQNLCMKCNEGGQLLACKTRSCPMMMHKNCLGESVQLDAKGNFFCPFCAYSHTISDYLEAKKNASLARKELAIFISKGIRNQATEHVHEFGRQEHSLSRKSDQCEHIHLEKKENGPLTGFDENRVDHVGKHANEVKNLQFERSEQQVSISYVYSSCREKENVNNGLTDDVRRKEDGGEMANSKSLTGGRAEEKEVPTNHVDGHGGDKFSCRKTNILSANKSNAGEVPQNMTTQHNMDGTVKPVCAHDPGKEDISEDECEKRISSRYTMRYRKHEIQYKPQACPQIRRRTIPWTVEEEELLREGMQKFGSDDPKIPWKKILAFGSHVFEKDDKRRTPQDLKDKWKNMCKARSKLK